MIRTYSELITNDSFLDRYNYLKLTGQVGIDTFGLDRYLNQSLYRSRRWYNVRNQVILRDNGCDLGVDGYDIFGKIIVHHMNPITVEQILNRDPDILNEEYLITTRKLTHNHIHYGEEDVVPELKVNVRTPNDTTLWK